MMMYLLEIGHKIGYLNLFYCFALLLSCTVVKAIFDDQTKGTTTKIINWTAVFLIAFFVLLGGDWIELIIATLAFQRFFKLIGYWIEKAYTWLFVEVVTVVFNLWNKLLSWFKK